MIIIKTPKAFASTLTIIGHPLEPGQCTPLHVEGGDDQPLVLWRGTVVEKLVDHKDSTKWFGPIKPGNIKFQTMRGGGGHRWSGIGREQRWRGGLRLG